MVWLRFRSGPEAHLARGSSRSGNTGAEGIFPSPAGVVRDEARCGLPYPERPWIPGRDLTRLSHPDGAVPTEFKI